MSKKINKFDIDQMLLDAHKIGVKNAIDAAARSNTRLVIYEDGKIKEVKPKYRYVRVPSKSSSRLLTTARKKKTI